MNENNVGFKIFTILEDEEESSTEEEESNVEDIKLRMGDKVPAPDKAASAKETEAGAEISALVNYVQPVHFYSFESAESTFTLLTIKFVFSFVSLIYITYYNFIDIGRKKPYVRDVVVRRKTSDNSFKGKAIRIREL